MTKANTVRKATSEPRVGRVFKVSLKSLPRLGSEDMIRLEVAAKKPLKGKHYPQFKEVKTLVA